MGEENRGSHASEWDCEACTFINKSERTLCEICGTPKLPDWCLSSQLTTNSGGGLLFANNKINKPTFKEIQNERITQYCAKGTNNFLSLESLTLTQIDPILYTISYLTDHAPLQKLFLSQNSLTLLPTELFVNFQSLTEIHLNYNNLITLPPTISMLTNLQKLYCSHNEIELVPAEIGACTNLINLSLFNNKLTSLPNEIGKLSLLENLFIYENKIKSLPRSVSGLTKLKCLQVQQNCLEEIPNEIGQLKHRLRKLDVSSNQLIALPPGIRKLTDLRVFNFEKNNFDKSIEGTWPIGVPSLVDLCCTKIVGLGGYTAIPDGDEKLNRELKEMLDSEGNHCAYCGGLYFGHGRVVRVFKQGVDFQFFKQVGRKEKIMIRGSYCSFRCCDMDSNTTTTTTTTHNREGS